MSVVYRRKRPAISALFAILRQHRHDEHLYTLA
jgi:hypothetical protein